MSAEDHGDASTSEAALVARAAAGDGEAFALLVARHAHAVQRVAERRLPRRLRRRVSVADVVQDAQLAALQNLAGFEHRGGGSFRSWLLGIVEHKVRDIIRVHRAAASRSLDREVPRARRGATGQLVARQATPSQLAIRAETAQRAKRAFARLPVEYRQVLTLTRTEGLNLRAAAVRMGRSYAATRKLVSRAMSRFEEEMRDGPPEGREAR